MKHVINNITSSFTVILLFKLPYNSDSKIKILLSYSDSPQENKGPVPRLRSLTQKKSFWKFSQSDVLNLPTYFWEKFHMGNVKYIF